MSGARIRYKDHKYRENSLISVQKFVSSITGATYKVILDLNDRVYFIRNERTKKFIKKSHAYGNLNVLKRSARAALEKLGVKLSKEVRNRTFGLCEKGFTQKKHEEKNKK